MNYVENVAQTRTRTAVERIAALEADVLAQKEISRAHTHQIEALTNAVRALLGLAQIGAVLEHKPTQGEVLAAAVRNDRNA